MHPVQTTLTRGDDLVSCIETDCMRMSSALCMR